MVSNKRKALTPIKRTRVHLVRGKRRKTRRLSRIKINKESIKYLEDMLDIDSMRIINMLLPGEMTDCRMAEKLKIRPNTVRRSCNELHVKGLLTYRKEKQKNGRYDYIWWIKREKLPEIIVTRKKEYLDLLKKREEKERATEYFICNNNCQRSMPMRHEEMLKVGAICPECGSMLTAYDNGKEIDSLQEEIGRFNELGSGNKL